MSATETQDPLFAVYENLAACAIRRHGHDARKLRKALAEVDAELFLATTPGARSGLEHMARRMADKLRELETRASGEPSDRERYP